MGPVPERVVRRDVSTTDISERTDTEEGRRTVRRFALTGEDDRKRPEKRGMGVEFRGREE